MQQLAMQPGLDPVVAKELRDRVMLVVGNPPDLADVPTTMEHGSSSKASDSQQRGSVSDDVREGGAL